ncbi:MAG: signal peptide peptidase SppA [Candidatus Stahlbacteria bacterium]|nr:signal peptide peptidase SppA [Candidatus Stahlbacteria bacterium]
MKKYWWVWAVIIAIVILGVAIIDNIKGSDKTSFSFGKSIGLIEISGVIESSAETIKNIAKCEATPNIKAIVVHIQSPGGSVVPSQEIYSALRKAKKPTVASLSDYAASGGYYIACACDQIVSNPGTLTGSIGVILSLPNVTELIKKVGLKFNVIKSRPYKDIGSPYRDLMPDEYDLLKVVVDDVYDQFVGAVVEGRGLDKEKVLEIADGRILSGRQAFELGLVDTLGTLEDAKLFAASLAGIKGEPKVVEFKKLQPRWVKMITEGIANKMRIRLEYR